MSAHDDLERQLKASVRARAAAGAPTPQAPPRRAWWRRRPLILVALPVVLVAGVATAATQITGGHSVGDQADRMVMKAMRDVMSAGGCRPNDPARLAPVVDAGAGPRIAAVLPQLAVEPKVAPSPAVVAGARRGAGEALLGPTVRTIDFPGRRRVLLFVTRGAAPGGFVDSRACAAAARHELAVRRATTNPRVYAAATRMVRRAFAAPQAREALHVGVGTVPTHGAGMVWGIGAEGRFPLPRTLRTGVWVSSAERGHDSVQAGIVGPDVALVRIVPAPGTKTRVYRTAHPRQGVFVFTLPRRHGAMVVRQYGADGRYLRSSPAR